VRPIVVEMVVFLKSDIIVSKAWLNDKIKNKLVIPAIYQPLSLIPIEVWKAGPQMTNGNEQAHRNINRDGINLTLLGGIMRGLQYDQQAMDALSLHDIHGIISRDQEATHFPRLERSVQRRGAFIFESGCINFLMAYRSVGTTSFST